MHLHIYICTTESGLSFFWGGKRYRIALCISCIRINSEPTGLNIMIGHPIQVLTILYINLDFQYNYVIYNSKHKPKFTYTYTSLIYNYTYMYIFYRWVTLARSWMSCVGLWLLGRSDGTHDVPMRVVPTAPRMAIKMIFWEETNSSLSPSNICYIPNSVLQSLTQHTSYKTSLSQTVVGTFESVT